MIKYLELDLTQSNSDNAFVGEIHTLTKIPNKPNRVLIPNHGLLYNDSVVLRTSAGVPLVLNKDYVVTGHHARFSELTGYNVSSMIVVTNVAVGDSVRLAYHALGHNGGLSYEAIREALITISDDNVEFTLDTVINKPTAYIPDDHKHEYWQLYGLDTTVEHIDRLGEMWPLGSKALMVENEAYHDYYLDLLYAQVGDYKTRINNHINNKFNPHETNVAQLGLDNLNNWPMATTAQILSYADSVYLPIGGVYLNVVDKMYPLLRSHLSDTSNPHGLTLAIMGLKSYAEIDALFSNKLKRGEAADSSKLIAGQNVATILNTTRTNLSTDNLKANTVFNRNVIATNSPPLNSTSVDYVLMGNNSFKHIPELFSTMRSNNSTWLYLPGQYGSRTASWNAIVGASAAPGTYIFSKYRMSGSGISGGWSVPDTLVGIRNANGSTTAIN